MIIDEHSGLRRRIPSVSMLREMVLCAIPFWECEKIELGNTITWNSWASVFPPISSLFVTNFRTAQPSYRLTGLDFWKRIWPKKTYQNFQIFVMISTYRGALGPKTHTQQLSIILTDVDALWRIWSKTHSTTFVSAHWPWLFVTLLVLKTLQKPSIFHTDTDLSWRIGLKTHSPKIFSSPQNFSTTHTPKPSTRSNNVDFLMSSWAKVMTKSDEFN